jgi:guanylate kinase
MLAHNPLLEFSISACTRKRRENETHGKDYYFLTEDDFKKKIASGEFLEYEEVYNGDFYGTLKSEVDRIWKNSRVAVFDVDVEGGLNIKRYLGPQALALFVQPPNVHVLEQRLRERSTETEETITRRIEKAVHELEYHAQFDAVIVNTDLSEALKQAENLVNDFLGAG